MKEKILIAIWIAVIVEVIALNKWYFGLVINSDLPDWLKWLFLKG